MTFTPKAWVDAPNTGTPVSATALIDLETRLAAYVDAVAAGGIELGDVADLTTQISTSLYPTLTALTGTSITVTAGSRPLLVWFGARLANSGTNPVILSLLEDSVEVAFQRYDVSTANKQMSTVWPARRTPSAGSHTYQLALSVITGGTASVIGTALTPTFIEVIQI